MTLEKRDMDGLRWSELKDLLAKAQKLGIKRSIGVLDNEDTEDLLKELGADRPTQVPIDPSAQGSVDLPDPKIVHVEDDPVVRALVLEKSALLGLAQIIQIPLSVSIPEIQMAKAISNRIRALVDERPRW